MQQYLKIWYIIITAATSWFGCNAKADKKIELQVENNKTVPLLLSPGDSSRSYGMDAQGMIFLFPSVI
jgi:hypothetical protein